MKTCDNNKVIFQVLVALIALMMEAASISKTSISFYQTTRRNNPEDRHLQLYCDVPSWLIEANNLAS
jgi:hypothetical protein